MLIVVTSQSRLREREEERRLNIRTLVIASVASATAAVLVSQVWAAGTWMAAAVTPVIVALVSELLHRPTEAIAEKVSVQRTRVAPRAAPEVGAREPAEPPGRIYRAQGRRRLGQGGPKRRTRRKIALGVVAVTALLAFAITAIAITGTELVTGGSIGKGDRDTTLFGGGRGDAQSEDAESQPSEGQGGSGQETPSQERPQEGEEQPQREPPQETSPAPSPPETPTAPAPGQ
jgi:hypothetical protein